MNQGAWRTAPAEAQCVFSTDDSLWEAVFRQIGQDVVEIDA